MTAIFLAYAGLFAWSFLAATVLPLSSEAPLAAIVSVRQQIGLPVLVATCGNYLGACTTYWLAARAARVLGSQSAGHVRAARLLRRYGPLVLLLSWVPILGDALVALAGALQVPFKVFSLWVVLGKALRYLAVAWIAASLWS